MTVTKIDPVWAENGALDTLITDAKISTGWIAGTSPDRPAIETFNLLQNRAENKINELAETVSTLSETGTRSDIIKKVFPKSSTLVNPMNTVNNKIAISTNEHRDATIGISGNTKKMFIVNNSQLALDIVDLSTLAVDSTLSTTNANDFYLPTTSAVYGVSCCSDETYIYILFRDTNNYYLHSYTFDMSPNVHWPVNGITWARTSASKNSIVRIANDDYLMIGDAAVTITSGSSEGVRIYEKYDGTYVGAGSGDTSATSGTVKDLASDGTTVYILINHATNDQLATMDIETPDNTGLGGSFPILMSPYTENICYVGGLILVTESNGSNTDNICVVYDSSIGTVETIQYNTTYYPTVRKMGTIISDGLFAYSRGLCQLDGSTDEHRALKIDLGSFQGTNTSIEDPSRLGKIKMFSLDKTAGLTHSSVSINAPICHDGQDLWVVGNNSSSTSAPMQGFLYRIAKPIFR